ncbi:MAG: efflux transporter outer membrane subunit [Sphingobium sp.]|uniref:efflux transporter outer membrane subunit n=1 Tax=Sphingobium sp. TaxID=1912891 RepID=UPI0029BA65CA|nr:efflux transporter outer membrane subunit [Sphingobium sp.]MDX3909374.1 efflux transporter outer membrane subunit [Sphingobium sp.]
MKRALSLVSLMALTACAVGPNYRTPAPLPPAQTALREASGSAVLPAEALPEKWWRLFNDPRLDGLVEQALAHNTDVRVASSNLRRARALLSQARADRLPTGTASAQAVKQRTAPVGAVPQAFEGEFYRLGYDASYEIDLFGRVSRSIEAGNADAAAAQAGLDVARVSIAAETARTYADVCGFGAQAAAARETVTLQSRTLDLTQRLLSGGGNTQRDVDQAILLVEQARAQLATAEAEQRAAVYALAVLTGQPPANADQSLFACTTLPTVAQSIPVGDGQTLLARRPDVRQAERQLAADTARIGVATAALYPSISLLGSATSSAIRPGDLGTSRSFGFSVGPLISWNFPFLGAARARVRENRAIAEGSLARFDQAVLTALQETEQALARLKGALDREAALTRGLAASNSAASIAERRFAAGADSFLQLLDAQRDRAATRAALASAQSDRASAQVALFKALGGGWEGAPEPVRLAEPTQ